MMFMLCSTDRYHIYGSETLCFYRLSIYVIIQMINTSIYKSNISYINRLPQIPMDWIENKEDYEGKVSFLKRIKNLTMYGHNYIIKTDLQNLSFSSVLNCKKMNRKYSIVAKIEGDLNTKAVEICCLLLDFGKIVVAKWNYQKIQLMKFAQKYNERNSQLMKTNSQASSFLIKTNPINGQFYVCSNFALTQEVLKDRSDFQIKITDECSKVGSEAQKVFNTVLEIIFFEEASEPYLKSDERIGFQYSKPVKIDKLFKKIKKMNSISSFYKLKQDISAPNKLRSLFKKVYIKKKEKISYNNLITENAIVFTPKFSSKHHEALSEATSQAKKNTQYIIPFEQLPDTLQIQIARHLQENLPLQRPQSKIKINLNQQQMSAIFSQPGTHSLQIQNFNIPIYTEQVNSKMLAHQYLILDKLGLKHPNMIQYYYVAQCPQFRITEYFDCMKLEYFLVKNIKSLSLVNKLDIMMQICHLVQHLHRNFIGFFIDFSDIYITEGYTIKVKNFSSAFSVTSWDQSKQDKKADRLIMPNLEDYKTVIGYRGDEPTLEDIKDYGKQQSLDKRLQNERVDVFNLGMVLYRILMGKFPFHPNAISILYSMGENKIEMFLSQIWNMETQMFEQQGGMVAKLLGQLLLKCFNMDCSKRPFVEWITVIISEAKSSLESLY